ncbi:flagellar protein FliO/FliZ [uncultured Thiomicrorhabdus sp.]
MLSKIRYYKAMLNDSNNPSLFSRFFLGIAISFFLLGCLSTVSAADTANPTSSDLSVNSETLEAQNSEVYIKPAGHSISIGQSVPQPSNYFSQIMLSLIFILLIIFAAAWLLRRYGRMPGVADGNLKVLGALSVGPRERILMLQVGKEQIVVGVTSSKISKLHNLAEPVEVAEPKPVSGVFAQRLQEAMQGKLNNQSSAKSEGEDK